MCGGPGSGSNVPKEIRDSARAREREGGEMKASKTGANSSYILLRRCFCNAHLPFNRYDYVPLLIRQTRLGKGKGYGLRHM